jgi:hypothetical protein
MVDCSQECADLDTLNAAASCGDSFDALTSCEAGLSNACDPSACAMQSTAYQTCATNYCMTHQSAAGCSHFGW